MPLQHTKTIIKRIFGGPKRENSSSRLDPAGQDESSHSAADELNGLSHHSAEPCEQSRAEPLSLSEEPFPAAQGDPAACGPPQSKPQSVANGSAKAPAAGPAGKNSFFFARVPPTITHDQLLELFNRFGQVEDLNLFRPFAEAKTSKGCGIVRYSTAAAAATAKAALHGKYKWGEDASAMVVEWVNEDKMRSTCCKAGTVLLPAGSSEVVFEPKSRAKAKKQQQQQQANSSSNAVAGSSNGSLQLDDATAAAAAAAAAAAPEAAAAAGGLLGCTVDTGSGLSSDQILLSQGSARSGQVYSGALHSGYTLHHHMQRNLFEQQRQQQQQQHLPPPPPPPPPPPHPSALHVSIPNCSIGALPGSSMAQQQQQQKQMLSCWTPVNSSSMFLCNSTDQNSAGGLMTPNSVMAWSAAALAQQARQQEQQLLCGNCTTGSSSSSNSSGPLPCLSVAAAAAAAQQANIVQAVMACCTGGGTTFTGQEAYVPTFRSLPQGLAASSGGLAAETSMGQQLDQFGVFGGMELHNQQGFGGVLGQLGSQGGLRAQQGYQGFGVQAHKQQQQQHQQQQYQLLGQLTNGSAAAAAGLDDGSCYDSLLLRAGGGGMGNAGCGYDAAAASGAATGGESSKYGQLSGFSLLDTSLSGLQPDFLITSQASNISAAHAAAAQGAAGDGGAGDMAAAAGLNNSNIDTNNSAHNCYNSSYSSIMHARANLSSSSGQQAGVGGSSGRPGVWRGSLDGSIGGAAAAAAATAAAAAAAEDQLQRHIASAGCNALSGGLGFGGTLSGTGLIGGSFRQQQQQHLQQQLEDPWAAGSGYFDMHTGSSNCSNQNLAGTSSGNDTSQGGAADMHQQQQQQQQQAAAAAAAAAAAVSGSHLVGLEGLSMSDPNGQVAAAMQQQQQHQALLASGPSGLRALSDPGMIRGLGGAGLNHGGLSIGGRPFTAGVPTPCPPPPPLHPAAAAAASCKDTSGAAASGLAGDFNLKLGLGPTGSAKPPMQTLTGAQGGVNDATPVGGAAAGAQVSVPVASGAAVVAMLAEHMASISELSGATVSIAAPSGELVVWVAGTAEQVWLARSIVQLMIQKQQKQQQQQQ